MSNFLSKILLVATFVILSSFSLQRFDFKEGRYKNVCKDLKGNALVYFIFVDTRTTHPWTEFDIRSTLDSITLAVSWLEQKAKENDVHLNIITDYYIGEKYSTISRSLPLPTIYQSATEPNIEEGMKSLNSWADKISRFAGSSVPVDMKDGIPEIEQPKNKERLIAYLRDRHQVESVALVYMINNYYKDDISIAINSFNTDDVEFAIVSYKYPAEIAHNILHLYGAADLHETIFRKDKKNIQLAQELYPNDIMIYPSYPNIMNLEIGAFTKYLIGWSGNIEMPAKNLLKDKASLNIF